MVRVTGGVIWVVVMLGAGVPALSLAAGGFSQKKMAKLSVPTVPVTPLLTVFAVPLMVALTVNSRLLSVSPLGISSVMGTSSHTVPEAGAAQSAGAVNGTSGSWPTIGPKLLVTV